MEPNAFRVGDRVVVGLPTPRAPALPRVGTIIELKKHKGLATVQWDSRDYLGFDVSTRTTDVLRKVTS